VGAGDRFFYILIIPVASRAGILREIHYKTAFEIDCNGSVKHSQGCATRIGEFLVPLQLRCLEGFRIHVNFSIDRFLKYLISSSVVFY